MLAPRSLPLAAKLCSHGMPLMKSCALYAGVAYLLDLTMLTGKISRTQTVFLLLGNKPSLSPARSD